MRRDKFRGFVAIDRVVAYMEFLRHEAQVVPDPDAPPPVRCEDPGDDYLVSLAHDQKAVLISGDRHLLALSGTIPVFSPGEFLATRL